MGSWFSNIQIKKNETVTADAVADYIRKRMAAGQYSPVNSEDEADGAFAIVSGGDTRWISVYSDLFSPDDLETFAKIAAPMSGELGAEVLGISCFDSDYLCLNLIDAAGGVDAWVGVGSAAGLGIKRRTGLSPWKKYVVNFPVFRESVQKKYVFAEEVLGEIAPCLDLPARQSGASYEYLEEFELNQQAVYLYFKLPCAPKTSEPPRLLHLTFSTMPCFLGKSSIVHCVNGGDPSKGLSVYFLGPYVEHDEITFSDVCFVRRKNNRAETVPFTLEKIQLPDGQWAYYYHDAGFRIPPKVDNRLPLTKQMNTSLERSITVRFIPHGNPRKMLDITVALVPDKNPQGQAVWNVWQRFGSKKAFLDQYNKIWDTVRTYGSPEHHPPHLEEEDFD